MSTATWIHGDVRAVLPTLPDRSVDLVACSPPFWRQRAYLPAGHPDKHWEIGQEASPADFLTVLLTSPPSSAGCSPRTGPSPSSSATRWPNSGGAGGDYNLGGFRDGQPKWAGSAPPTALGSTARIAGGKPWLDKDGPPPKSHCMIPEAYRFALA